MTTIAQTLTDIEQLQAEIAARLDVDPTQDMAFVDEIRRLLTVYYFDLLAHSSLDTARADLKTRTTANPFAGKYFDLSESPGVLEDYVRWLNTGGLFIAWNIFEKFVRERYTRIFNESRLPPLKDAYRSILTHRGLDKSTAGRMRIEFNLLRFVRSTLQRQSNYRNRQTREFDLDGEAYVLEAGQPVKQIRLMTVIQLIWRHYRVLQAPLSAS